MMASLATTKNRLLGGFLLLTLALTATVSQADDKALEAVIAAHWQWALENYPEMRLGYGDRSGNAEWTDMSLAAQQERQQALTGFSKQLTLSLIHI